MKTNADKTARQERAKLIADEVKALRLKARLMEAAQQGCGHDWVFDRPSQIRPDATVFYGSSVCRICGERRANSERIYGLNP